MTLDLLRLTPLACFTAIAACATAPVVEEVPCSGHGELHDHGGVKDCDCDDGFVDEGLRCVEDPDGNDAGEGEGEGEEEEEEDEGCGAHGEDHGGHCHCDVGYVEIDGVCAAPPACIGPDDGHEDNDGPDAAVAIADIDSALHACPVDEDWFHLDAVAGETITIDVRFAQADGDLDIYAWAAGVVGEATYTTDPIASGISEDDDETITFVSAGGSHLFVVVGYETAEAPYTIIVTRR